MSTTPDRRTRIEDTLAVENAIQLSRLSGIAAAMYYLHKKGLRQDVIERVLRAPHNRRAHIFCKTDSGAPDLRP